MLAGVSKLETYKFLLILKCNILLLHSAEDNLKGMQQVLEDGDLPLFALLHGESFFVY